MPGTKQTFLKYSEQQMTAAINDVQRGMPIATAAKKHQVPRVTLLYKVRGKTPVQRKMGRDSYLRQEEEKLLVSWISKMARAGFPIQKQQLIESVQRLMMELKRDNPFKENKPGNSWYASFLKRNPEISIRTPQNLTITRSVVGESQIKAWAKEVHEYLTTEKLDDVLKEPSRVFNTDEAAFFLNPKGNKVLAKKGEKNVYQIVNSDEKECLTVLITANAAGDLAPPLVVFKYERIPREVAYSVPENWGIGKSDTGWMTGETFFEFLGNVFHPWLLEKKIVLPIILFIDGHTSHLTLQSSRFCEENGIILVALFPNATHKIQPMDVAVFRTLKAGWKDQVYRWRLDNKDDPTLRKIHFCSLLKNAITERVTPEVLKNGFKTCGLVPWNPEAVKFSTEEQLNSTICSTKTEMEQDLKRLKNGKYLIEQYLEKDKIKQFTNSEVWDGNIEDLSLFQISRDIDEVQDKVSSNDRGVNAVQETDSSVNAHSEKVPSLKGTTVNEIEPRTLLACSDGIGINQLQDKLSSYDQGVNLIQETARIVNAPIEMVSSLTTKSVNESELRTLPAFSYVFDIDQPKMKVSVIQDTIIHGSPLKPGTSAESNISTFSDLQSPALNDKTTLKDSNSPNLPTPFKRALFFEDPKPKKIKKRLNKDKVPAVVSSKKYQKYLEDKQNAKKIQEEQKKQRAEERRLKKIEREKLKAEKKAAREKKKKPQLVSHSDSETCEDEEWVESGDSLDDISFQETMDVTDSDDENKLQFKESDYVLVSFPGKKKVHRYVCVIQTIFPNDEAEVVGMKQFENDKKVFKLNDNDVSIISLDQILEKLNFPKITAAGDRLKYEFDKDIEVDG